MNRPDRRSDGPADADLDAVLFQAFFGDRSSEPAPPFSTDLATAWILLQRLRSERGRAELVGTERGSWICRIHDLGRSDAGRPETVVEEAPTAPLAISRAALRVGSRRCNVSAPASSNHPKRRSDGLSARRRSVAGRPDENPRRGDTS